MNDLDRARQLGMTLEEFQSLVGHDPQETYPEFTGGAKHGGEYSADDSKSKKDKKEKKDKKSKANVQDYGLHTHDESNPLGLHSHFPGGPLGGAHTHSAQNPLGHHTHRYSREELTQFKFARPGIMIDLDGPHNHDPSKFDFQEDPVHHDTPYGNHKHDPDLAEPAGD